MLCSRFTQFTLNKTGLYSNIKCHCLLTTRLILKQCRIDELLASIVNNKKEVRIMSLRFLLRDLGVNKLRNAWTRSVNIGNVVKRYKKDRSVRDVILSFRQAFFRPRRTLLLSATAAYKAKEDDEQKPPSCEQNISDEELKALLSDLDVVEELSQTLYCPRCNKRLVIDKKQPGVRYCVCKETQAPVTSGDGWEPYMEAEDVIIWRKEYKSGQGLYAYKVYGRYREVTASHFAAVQVDGGYRRVWDSAVAALAVVERSASVPDQAIIHWEVLWPRLFANRDYVYLRRHKSYDVNTKSTNLFEEATAPSTHTQERPSVHSNAKRKAIENYSRDGDKISKDNKVYIIISKSCEHPKVPESKHAIRVSEYWSHMVVRTLDGADNPGMEFVLTYYDEPAVGGLPHGVAAWATGRAAPAYLNKMRHAAKHYLAYKQQLAPETPDALPSEPEKVSYEEPITVIRVSEQDMESSKQGPDLENSESGSKDQSTQTDDGAEAPVKVIEPKPVKVTEDKAVGTTDLMESNQDSSNLEEAPDSDKSSDEETNSRWWRYLHPFYYFV